MKKLLTFLTLLTLFFTTAGAETVTCNLSAVDPSESSITMGGITWNYSITWDSESPGKQNLDGTKGAQIGTGTKPARSVVFSTAQIPGTITEVKVNASTAKQGTATLSVAVGGSTYDTKNLTSSATDYTFTGTKSGEIVITMSQPSTSKALYLKSIRVTYTTEIVTSKVDPVTITPNGGTFWEPQTVTLSCETEGAAIEYSYDGTNYTSYSGPLTISENKHLYAKATKLNYDPSDVTDAIFTINTPQNVVVPPSYEEAFTGGFGKFYEKEVSNSKPSNIWTTDNTYGAVASGRSSTNTTAQLYASESWLISPFIDLTNATSPELSFSHAGNRFTTAAAMKQDVSVLVKKQGDTQWTELTIGTWPDGTSWTFVDNTTSLSAYAGEVIQIAFKYTSTTSRAGIWEIKNFKVENVATKYSVTCNTADNGSITTDEDEYAEGETVNVTVTPDPGYELATLVYNDGVDHDIKDAKSFNMPASNVTVTATFSKVGDLYVMGNVNGIDVNGWHANQGVKMDFINGAYTADIWVTGKWNDEMQKNAGSFAFTKVLANNGSGEGAWGWVNGYGHRIQPSANGKYYWLNSGSVSNIPLYVRGDNDGEKEFLIPAGLYTITVTPADPSVQNDTWKFSLVEKNLAPTITPDGGDVALNSTATVALSEDFNEFIANCPKVLECTPGNGSDVYTELSLTLPEVKLVLNGNVAEGTTTDYEFATAGSVTLTSEGKLMFSGSEITSATKTATATFNVTEVDMSNVYTLVKSATDLVAGGEYLIVSSKGDDTYNVLIGEIGGTTAKPYATAIIEASIYDATRECITLPEGCLATPLTLGYDETTQKYTFYNGSGYLNSPEDDNYLNTSSSISNTSQWIIDTNEFPASNKLIQNSERTTRYIAFNASSPRFACYAGTQQPVALFKKGSATPSNKTATPVITPDSKDVKGGLLEGITITAGEEGTTPVIYYTTDGSDPGDASNANRVQYTEPFNIQVTQGGPQTVKVIAIENGKDPSNVVSVQYMFKNPDAPTFTPDPAVVQTGDFTITINSADGGVIYYVLDPDANEFPSNSEEAIATGQVYADVVAVSGTGEHKIYAAVVLNGLKSTLSTATYTVIETGAEGDWQLVTSVDQITDGYDYIIVNSDHDRAIKSGDLETSRFYSVKCENNVVFGPNFATATVAGSDVRIFGFETEGDNIYMKDADNSRYYNFATDVSTGKQPVYITMADGFVYIKGAAEATKSLAYNTANGNYFGIYATPTTTTGSQRPIYLYRRGKMTLAQIESKGVVNTKYAVADPYLVAVASREVSVGDNSYVYVWCKDNKNVASPITVGEGVIDFMRTGNNAAQAGDWDQSNWVVLRFNNNDPAALALAGSKLTNVVGTYVDKNNYMIDVESYTKGDTEAYTPNVYCVANFNPDIIAAGGLTTQANDDNKYFFMPPKVQEVCTITFAEWNGTAFQVPASSGFEGTLTLGWDYNQDANGTPVSQTTVEAYLNGKLEDAEEGETPAYKFLAVVQNNSSKGAVTGATKVYPMDLVGDGNDIPTAISSISAGNGEVKSVKYVNVAGMVSDVPFQGVNIVVTEYSDGSRSTSKMLRK